MIGCMAIREEKKKQSSLQNNVPLSILHHVWTLTTIVRLTTATFWIIVRDNSVPIPSLKTAIKVPRGNQEEIRMPQS